MKLKPKTKAEDDAEVMLRIRRSRMDLLSKHPFFGDLAMKMPIVLKPDLPMPTAATDGETLYYHPDFVKSLDDEELMFVTAHEVVHAAYQHVQRRGDKDDRWLLAVDIVTNQVLHNNQVGKRPKDCIFDPQLYNQGEGLVEKIYDLLKPDDKRKPMDDHVKPGDGQGEGKPQPGDAAANASKWQGRLAQAQEFAKGMGNMPGELEMDLNQTDEDTVAWEDEIVAEMTADKGEDRTYAKKNRRYAALDVLMPGKYGDECGDIVFAIDCSGSTSDHMVQRCGANVKRAAAMLRPERIHVLYFDTCIKKHEEFGPDDDFEVKVVGRGGTAFSPIFKYIEEKGIEPQHVIVATDMDCDDFGPEPDYPVIWCAMDAYNLEAPFGRVINADA